MTWRISLQSWLASRSLRILRLHMPAAVVRQSDVMEHDRQPYVLQQHCFYYGAASLRHVKTPQAVFSLLGAR
jgi:hypothetical protein